MDESDRDQLPEGIPGYVVDTFVRATMEGYQVNFQHYDPEDAGHSPWGFGTNVHSSICSFLERSFEHDPLVSVRRIRNTVEVRVREFVFRVARLRGPGRHDVRSSSVNYRPTAEQMALENGCYTPALTGVDWGRPRQFFIGHFGNPDDGCTAVFLCAPKLDWERGRLDWELCVPVFFEETGVFEVPGERGEEPSPEIISDDIPMELKDEESEEEGQ